MHNQMEDVGLSIKFEYLRTLLWLSMLLINGQTQRNIAGAYLLLFGLSCVYRFTEIWPFKSDQIRFWLP